MISFYFKLNLKCVTFLTPPYMKNSPLNQMGELVCYFGCDFSLYISIGGDIFSSEKGVFESPGQ